jgi:hypothetical protein
MHHPACSKYPSKLLQQRSKAYISTISHIAPKHALSSVQSCPTMSDPSYDAITWFSSFLNFVYDATATLKSNFNRLAIARNWGKCKRWIECQVALFGSLYGTDTTKLEMWQDLCREVHIQDPPASITGCKKVSVHRLCILELWLT